MSKKKKRKTRKEKQLSESRRDVYVKKNDIINKEKSSDMGIDKDEIVKQEKRIFDETKNDKEDKFTVSNIKRAAIYALIFFLIVVLIYILDQKYHYLTDIANRLMDLVI